ncbi:XYPPX repeat family protein [Trichomonas vaginalis G3]|uniref:XYPPX repeat family protein n=1 Tax=Trichomonas vaginalis (strain ATCC PRA-98 / G3) TaxID=412133 RepID=A2DFS2_TRIV3|nr:hypothetical protein TVAGG3_0323080 [Trichomonas vaginalis G3]EAY20775.1 XYPPX repeat family protein [Trichomonas vaginalis G3]KAI5529440.1 hypothetical protein TVAGG3_0323080 [Trichomonas vaginalis G3]|eukprot:XP_001581761.1 XYPPX repeat family protein [Trichomonas vaginalis G3]
MSYYSSYTPSCDHYVTRGFFEKEYVCVSDATWAFVGPVPYGFILLFVVPWVINIILWLIAYCKNRKVHVPFWYLIISMLQNVLLALIVWGVLHIALEGMGPYFAAIGFGVIGLIASNVMPLLLSSTVPIDGKTKGLFLVRVLLFKEFCKCCCALRLKMMPKHCIMKEEKVSKLRDRIAGNPPILMIRIKNGFANHRVGFCLNEPLKYGSWEGNDDLNLDIDGGITIVKVKTELEVSEEVHNYFNLAKHEYFKKLRALNTTMAMMSRRGNTTAVWLGDPEVELAAEIYKVPNHFSACGKSAYVKFMNSGFGKFLYGLFMIFGYSIFFDNLFIILAKYKKITVKRKVSHDGSLRIPAYKPNTQFSQEEYTSESLNYGMMANQNAAYLQMYSAEMQRNQYNNQYSFAPSPYGSDFQLAYGAPPQQGAYPPPQGYPNYQMPPQQGGYPPQQGGYPPQGNYPPPQGYPPQQGGYPPPQQNYAAPPPPPPRQQKSETKNENE